VAGLFGPLSDENGAGAFAVEHAAKRAALDASTDVEGYEADCDDEAAKVGKNVSFDWAAYQEAWGDTPVHVAVTSMFAEYAVLYARIAGRTTCAVPPPMTLTEGRGIGQQATTFVNGFVTPILGHVASVKIHKLLCHVAEAVQWHGNPQKGNTAANESGHRADKPYYARTSKDGRTFTRQLVRHAHGAWGILARHDKADVVAAATWKAELLRRRAAAGHGAVGARRLGLPAAATSSATSVSGVAAAAGAASAEERVRKQKRRVYNVGKVSVGDLATRPDLANIAALLCLAPHRHVRVATRTPIIARFDCGARVQHQVRAAEDCLRAPWYYAVLYHPGGDESRLCIGELRTIVRGPNGDAVVLVPLEVVPPEPLCPFVARGCLRLKWRVVENASDVTLRLVPVEHVRRLAFVVADFADLASRCGVDADPPTMDSPLQERLDMRFFLNAFFPWDVK